MPDGAEEGGGGAQAAVGAVLSAKALSQLVSAPVASRAVSLRGPAVVLRLATVLLALAALVFAGCGQWVGWRASLCAGGGRVLHGVGGALGGVSGLALAAAALSGSLRERALSTLLGAVALGVLVGYPFGGAACGSWGRSMPFLFLAGLLISDLALQMLLLNDERFYKVTFRESGDLVVGRWLRVRPPGVACGGAVLCSTSVMAALEPSLPLWIHDKFNSQGWESGVVFVPDSAGYLIGTCGAGAVVSRFGPECAALVGQLAVALGAIAIPHATSVRGLVIPHAVLGLGLGVLDGALVPALLARDPHRPHRAPRAAALLQAAGSAAYVLGPMAGGLISWRLGFEFALRLLALLNLVYVCFLYRALSRHPLSRQWGAPSSDEEDQIDEESSSSGENVPLGSYLPLQ